MDLSKEYRERIEALNEVYIKKNNDYGNSAEESLDEFGLIASIVRLGDKMNRLKSLSAGGRQLVNDESLEDTLLDLANYAVITIMWLDADFLKEVARAPQHKEVFGKIYEASEMTPLNLEDGVNKIEQAMNGLKAAYTANDFAKHFLFKLADYAVLTSITLKGDKG